MNRTGGTIGTYALVIGAFLLIEGIWGLFSPVVFGVFTTNMLHACIHIILGLAGIWTGLKGGARKYCIFLGIVLLAVGAIRFVPSFGFFIAMVFNLNEAVAYFNMIVGLITLLVAYRARPVAA